MRVGLSLGHEKHRDINIHGCQWSLQGQQTGPPAPGRELVQNEAKMKLVLEPCIIQHDCEFKKQEEKESMWARIRCDAEIHVS